MTVDPQERSTWRSGVRSAMRAASQLPGKGPTDLDDAPYTLIKNPIMMIMITYKDEENQMKNEGA